MKKTFPLHVPGKPDERVLEEIRRDVRRYVKRERRKPVPVGFTVWEFDCKVGPEAAVAETRSLPDIGAAIDAVARSGAPTAYVEIVARAAHRMKSDEETAPSST